MPATLLYKADVIYCNIIQNQISQLEGQVMFEVITMTSKIHSF